ncbi:Eukaryotic translation initiation factor 4B [Arthrobacter sp. 9AX]|uniref:hypothetical protein n=1 Tax=Arthrobacter sp. 9AX TaxID=2653131 RepID=UPI0012F20958|nr:hypothetical protein [Arthrobacter sp. 9AX]VXB94348.1 Eukaryotic translation initiation factor 4B [Arthrobacter sp. 9AX]
MSAGKASAPSGNYKAKVVGSVETAPWVWVIVAIVVVVLIVLLLLATGRRRKALQQKRDDAHREKAAEIRRDAQDRELDAREREAKAARAKADAEQAQVDAARLRQQAEHQATEAKSLREDIADRTRKADELDPDVTTGRGDRSNREGIHHGDAAAGVAGPGDGADAARDGVRNDQVLDGGAHHRDDRTDGDGRSDSRNGTTNPLTGSHGEQENPRPGI